MTPLRFDPILTIPYRCSKEDGMEWNFEDPLASYRWILNRDFPLFPELFGGNAYFNRVQRPQKHRDTWFLG